MFDPACTYCVEMATSQFGIEEPHEAHANKRSCTICTGCQQPEYTGDIWDIAGEPYCQACADAYLEGTS